MNRRDFQRLSATRLGDAEALLTARRYSAAYYLAGYAVECALKARIAKQTRRYDFPPDPRTISRIYTHQLDTLVQAADLRRELDAETSNDPQFKEYWTLLAGWSEQARYEVRSRADAVGFVIAGSDDEHGVLQWLRRHW